MRIHDGDIRIINESFKVFEAVNSIVFSRSGFDGEVLRQTLTEIGLLPLIRVYNHLAKEWNFDKYTGQEYVTGHFARNITRNTTEQLRADVEYIAAVLGNEIYSMDTREEIRNAQIGTRKLAKMRFEKLIETCAKGD